MISETQTRSSGTLPTSAKKRSSCFAGAFVTSSPFGADGSDNTKRCCKPRCRTPIDGSESSPDVADAPRKLLTVPYQWCYMNHYLALQSHRNRLSDHLGGPRWIARTQPLARM